MDLLKGLAQAFSFDDRRDANTFLKAIIETTPECIKVVAPNGDLLHMNSAGLTMIGSDSWDRVAGACTFDLIADEHRAGWLAHHERVCAGERLGWEFDIVSLDGTRRHMETHAVPIDLDDGTTGQLAITRDVSGRRRAEAALQDLNDELEERVRERTGELRSALQKLQDTERNLALMIDSVSDYAIYRLDPEGHIESWNGGAERIKGYSAEEIIGQNFSKFYTQEDLAAGRPQFALTSARRDGRFESEGWRVCKDGTRFFASVVVDAIYADGDLIGFAKITRDITEKREAEAKLRQAQKMEAVGQFTGGAAHDFNNLLSAVLGSLELLRKRLPDDDPRARALLENAVEGAKRGALLTQRMLAFARRQDLQQEAVELTALIYGMSDLLNQIVSTNIQIETRLPRSLPAVMTDPGQLETALLNLVANARDAMPSGGAITISARPIEVSSVNAEDLPPGSYVCLLVEDDGEGMDEATLAKVTEPFFTTKGIGKGTGLGLPMVDGLAAQSGGKLVLRSQPGFGTAIELWLPVADPVIGGIIQAASGSTEDAVAQRELKVLAVDDDALVLMNTAAMLEDLGHLVIEASSAKQAIEIIEQVAIDLVVTDHAMPGMTGLQLVEVVGATNPNLPFVLATGYAELPNDGARPFVKLDKPFMQDQLADAVSQAFTSANKSK